MGEYNFFRPLSNEEQVDTVAIGSTDILSTFLKKLADVQTEFNKKLRPFDAYGAKIDFEHKVRNKINDISTNLDREGISRTIDFGDLEAYGNTDRFEFIERAEQQVTKLVAGTINNVSIGYRYKFKCIAKGNRISIYVENSKIDEFEKWLNEEFLKDDKLVKKAPTPDEPMSLDDVEQKGSAKSEVVKETKKTNTKKVK